MAAQPDELPFARQERLRFVESMLLWEGEVQRSRVCEVFGVSANHVTRDFQIYLRDHPGSLEFRPRQRAYVPGPRFTPVFASDAPAEYLGLLQTRAETGSVAVIPLLGGEGTEVGVLPSPAIGIDKGVLQEVVRAIRQGSGVRVTYHSLRAERAAQHTLWPHALFNTGVRWYARAFDAETQRFRDFALSRMDRPASVAESRPAKAFSDAGWEDTVVAEVVPHPKLNTHQQGVVAREFAMARERKEWIWRVTLRLCLVGYFARRYRLDATPPVPPQSHWVILRNRMALKRYFLSEVTE